MKTVVKYYFQRALRRYCTRHIKYDHSTGVGYFRVYDKLFFNIKIPFYLKVYTKQAPLVQDIITISIQPKSTLPLIDGVYRYRITRESISREEAMFYIQCEWKAYVSRYNIR